MLFAQAAPPGTENFLAITFYLVGGITAVVLLIKSLRKPEAVETEIGGQPIKVKFAAQFATKEEHETLRQDFGEFRREVSTSFEKAASTSRESREKIYVEQRRQGEMLAANNRETELTRQTVASLSLKIDKLLSHQSSK